MDVPSVPEITRDGTYFREEAERLEETDLATDDDLMNLKALTKKLRLETRRPSYQEWKARLKVTHFHAPGIRQDQEFREKPERKEVTPKESEVCPDLFHSKLSSGVLKGFGNLDEALKWLKRELVSQEFYQLVFFNLFFGLYFVFVLL